MENFKKWLEQLSPDEETILKQYGYVYLDSFEIGDVKMILLQAPAPPKYRYHLAFQKKGQSAFDIPQQFNRKKKEDDAIGIFSGAQILRPLMDKLMDWVKTYRRVVIASHNPELTKKWVANITIATRYFELPLELETDNIRGQEIHLVKLA